MWLEIFCGLLAYKLFGRFFFSDDDLIPPVDSLHSESSFEVANRLEKIHGGKAFVGLRIPDADVGSRRSIDVVLVTKTEMMVVAVKSLKGFVEVAGDGNWVCNRGELLRPEMLADPITELTKQTEVLSSYLEQRGLTLPKGYLTTKVVLPNPNCRVSRSLDAMPEVITFEKWAELKPESKGGFSSWIKDAFGGSRQGESYQNLLSILNTSPMWDRLELQGTRNILGEFVEFKGKMEEMQALRDIKRSKVSRLIVQKSTAFVGLGRSKLHVLYAPRDYRNEGTSSSEWKEATVKSGVEVLFLPQNSKKAQKFKLSHITSLTLSV